MSRTEISGTCVSMLLLLALWCQPYAARTRSMLHEINNILFPTRFFHWNVLLFCPGWINSYLSYFDWIITISFHSFLSSLCGAHLCEHDKTINVCVKLEEEIEIISLINTVKGSFIDWKITHKYKRTFPESEGKRKNIKINSINLLPEILESNFDKAWEFRRIYIENS